MIQRAEVVVALEWFKAAVPLGVATIAAWTGYRYGLRKTRDERALDRRVAWYEVALAATDVFRDALLKAAILEGRRALVDDRENDWRERLGDLREATSRGWSDVQDRSEDLVRVLKRGLIYADGSSQEAAGRAVALVVSAADFFVPLERYDPDAHPIGLHVLHVTSVGERSPDLRGILHELRAVDEVMVASVRSTLGYLPRARLTPGQVHRIHPSGHRSDTGPR